MNPHRSHSISLRALYNSFWLNRWLIFHIVKRDVQGRYRGAFAGLIWSFVNPLLMLTVYTFVFSVVFKARWGGDGDTHMSFALILFVGMIVHGFFSEVINRAPGLIFENVNYVKKVVFPLEILSITSIGCALVHTLMSVLVLMLALILIRGGLPWTTLFLPLIFLPLLLLSLGFSWFIASLGVYVRDVGQAVGVITTILLFLSPVFFPITALPEQFRIWILLNPLTFVIEESRAVLLWGTSPNWLQWGYYSIAALFVSWVGYAWFQKSRKGFSDVL